MHDNSRYVLMLENDSDDKYFTESALAELNLNIPVIFSSDRELLTENHTNPPSLILIAYNIYPHTGIEILKKLKASSVFGHIPAVVLCEDIPAEEIRKYYRAGASSVIKKPYTVELTRNKIRTFFNYWFNVAEL